MIAIHYSEKGFAKRWIEFCKQKNVPYKLVCCYDNNIIEQLSDCKVLMWHHHQTDARDVLTAKRILFALEHAGIVVFPDFRTGWHFDDKVAQKYLFEALAISHVKSYVFYTKKEAINFLNTEAKFPIVFKLKGGAGSVNVKLLKNEWQAKKFVNRAFGSGFSNVDVWSMVKDKFRLARQKKTRHSWMLVFNSLLRLFVKNDYQKIVAKEREYIYFQDFIPDCDSDIRIIIVGEKVFGMKRYVRKGDFRASGSEQISYEGIPISVVKAGIEASQRLKVQSIALDYIVTHDGQPLIVEASYGFGLKGSSLIPGFWTFDLKWHVDANESKIQDEILLQVCKSANVDVSIS